MHGYLWEICDNGTSYIGWSLIRFENTIIEICWHAFWRWKISQHYYFRCVISCHPFEMMNGHCMLKETDNNKKNICYMREWISYTNIHMKHFNNNGNDTNLIDWLPIRLLCWHILIFVVVILLSPLVSIVQSHSHKYAQPKLVNKL